MPDGIKIEDLTSEELEKLQAALKAARPIIEVRDLVNQNM